MKIAMSTVELKTSAKNMIDSLDLTNLNIKFKRRPLSQKVKDMSVKIDFPTDFDEKELYHKYLIAKYNFCQL